MGKTANIYIYFCQQIWLHWWLTFAIWLRKHFHGNMYNLRIVPMYIWMYMYGQCIDRVTPSQMQWSWSQCRTSGTELLSPGQCSDWLAAFTFLCENWLIFFFLGGGMGGLLFTQFLKGFNLIWHIEASHLNLLHYFFYFQWFLMRVQYPKRAFTRYCSIVGLYGVSNSGTEMGRFLGITVKKCPLVGAWMGTLKNPTKCLWVLEPDRRFNFFFSPPAHLHVCTVKYFI